MKQYLMTLAAVLCCAIIPAGNIQAQDEGQLNFTITQMEKTTYYLFGDDNTLDTPYQGEELRAGLINVKVKMEANNETDNDVVTPANLLFHLSFTDPYGRMPLLYESNDDLTKIFDFIKYSDYLKENTNCARSICRGGQYVYRNYIPGLDYNYEETIEVKDEPSARVRYNSVNVGNNIEVKTFYNTGYPYDVNQFNGSEKATLRLFALGKNENGDITGFLDEYLDDLKGTKGKGYISFITCNHDTPRMTRMFSPLEAKIAYSFVFMMPGVPFLYYGDEIGMSYMEGLTSKEGGFSRTGTRTPMQWDDSPNHGFSSADADKLYLPVDTSNDAVTVEKAENDPDSILNTLRKVIAVRHANPDLQSDGDFEVIYAVKEKYPFIFKRGQFIIAVNPTDKQQSAPFAFDCDSVFEIGSHEQKDNYLVMQPQTISLMKIR